MLATTLTLGCVATSAGCKAKDNVVREENTINVRLYKAGFGMDFLYELKDKFEAVYAEQGYKVNIPTPSESNNGDAMIREMYKGYDKTGIDLYVTGAIVPNQVSKDGEYGELCEDLEEIVYNQPAIEYDGTESALVSQRLHSDIEPFLRADDGTMYAYTWANTTAGMVVNAKKLAAYGITDPSQYPKTTNELFALFDTIKETSKSTKVYPVTYDLGMGQGRAAGYNTCAIETWLAQYDIDAFKEFTRMQTYENGQWTDMEDAWKVYDNENLREVLEVGYQFMDYKYALPGSSSQTLLQAQNAIMEDYGSNAVFMLNGDWFLNEVMLSYDNLDDIDFMNVPVISSLGVKLFGEGTAYNLSEADCDTLLSYICQLVDEDKSVEEIKELVKTEKGIELALEDVQAVATARGICFARGIEHLAFITKGSDKAHIAALFLRMMASDDYAETFMRTANGVSPYASEIVAQSQYQFSNSAKALSGNQHYRAINFRVQGLRREVFHSDYFLPGIDNLSLRLYDKAEKTSYTDAADKLYEDSLKKVKELWNAYLK